MQTLIVSKNFETACKKMWKILEEKGKDKIKILNKNDYEFVAILENYSVITAKSIDENFKHVRSEIIYVDNKIDLYTYNQIIRRMNCAISNNRQIIFYD